MWAAGILLYKLVAGKTPFESEYHHQTIQNIRGADLVFTPAFDGYSNELRSFLTLLLSRNIEERPSSYSCKKDSWLSSLSMSTASKKGEENMCDKTLQIIREPTRSKCRLQAQLSLDVNLQEL